MKLITGLFLCFPFAVAAATSPVTPETLKTSVAKIGAAQTVRSLDEQGFGKLTQGIISASPDWLARVPELASGLEGGNADAVVVALARGLAKDPVAVLKTLSAPGSAALPGREKVCSMPFPVDDETSLARYYRKTEPALKKLGKPVAPCLEKLNHAFTLLRDGAQTRQNYALNRKAITPALMWQALDKDGVEKVASSLSPKQRKAVGDSISQGNREWLLIAGTLASASDQPTRSMLQTSLASALTVNPGDVLKVAEGNFDPGLLCAMPFPEASEQTLVTYYHKTRTALLKIRRRGEACLKTLDDEYATMRKQ